MATTLLLEHVAAYAAQVRSALADLEAEQLHDLTDGLEADLAADLLDVDGRPITGEIPIVSGETAGSSESLIDLTARFGAPELYAAELRAAAGISPAGPRSASKQVSVGSSIATWVSRIEQSAQGIWLRLGESQSLHGVRDFVISLRPVWWVARGATLATLLSQNLFPQHAEFVSYAEVQILLAIVLIVASVQYGRGAWRLSDRWRVSGVVVSVIAVIAFVPVIGTAQESSWARAHNGGLQDGISVGSSSRSDGAFIDDEAVENLFVYGPSGELIDGARIFDQAGRPLRIDGLNDLYGRDEGAALWQPRLDSTGAVLWNAYPMATAQWSDLNEEDIDYSYDNWSLNPNGAFPGPRPPFAALPLLKAGAPADAEGPAEAKGPAATEPPTQSPAETEAADPAVTKPATQSPAETEAADPADVLAPAIP